MSDVITGSRTCFESQCCVSRRAGEERRWMCSGRLGKLLALSGNYERALVYIHAPWSCRYHLWASSSRLSLASHRTIGLIIHELNSISFPSPLPFYSYPCSLILLIFQGRVKSNRQHVHGRRRAILVLYQTCMVTGSELQTRSNLFGDVKRTERHDTHHRLRTSVPSDSNRHPLAAL